MVQGAVSLLATMLMNRQKI